MTRDAIVKTLRDHEADLRAAGIVSLALFGSAARSENTERSDIDLLAAFDERVPLSLLDVVRLENFLGDLLDRKVDLVEERVLKARLRRNVEKDLVRAF